MSDELFNADRAAGIYPPKGWGWKDADRQRAILKSHFDRSGPIDAWMWQEAARLGVAVPADCNGASAFTPAERT